MRPQKCKTVRDHAVKWKKESWETRKLGTEKPEGNSIELVLDQSRNMLGNVLQSQSLGNNPKFPDRRNNSSPQRKAPEICLNLCSLRDLAAGG